LEEFKVQFSIFLLIKIIFSGEKMFSGCRFARPTELKHEPSKMFYKQEIVALMAVDAVERMENVQNPCAILTLKQYEQCK
jgi:hypothetical protein